MCGIAGWACLDPGVLPTDNDKSILTAMCDRMCHRGPDSAGDWYSGGIAMQMRRLAVIDLATGGQPVKSADGSIVVVLNGEIYNYREIKASLEQKGYRFRTTGDAEVLPALYQEFGESMLERLNGMFAFALWDANKRKLFIARDRLGEKPLYYGTFGGKIIFASELKALIAHPAVETRLNVSALRQYLTFDYVPAPNTIFQNIFKLPAAHCLTVEDGIVEVRPYWNLSYKKHQPMPSLDEAAEQLRNLLSRATDLRMAADVPLGVLLSGGVDSSAVAALAQRSSSRSIKTFCVGFDDLSHDETAFARKVARHLDTEHYTAQLSAGRAAELIPDIAVWLDEPLSDPSILPTYLLSRFARSMVTVALGGEGGDEVFAGYPTYYAHKMAERYEQIPLVIRRRLIDKLVLGLPVSLKSMSFDFLAKRFVRSLRFSGLAERHQSLLGSFLYGEQEELLTNDIKSLDGADIFGEARHWLELCDAQNVIERSQFLDTKMYLADGILTKVDRASMAVSLEIRTPFLDPNVVEFGAGLSEYYKLHCQTIKFAFGKTGKFVLKKAFADILPAEVLQRTKKGFVPPISTWLKGKLNTMLHDLLGRERLQREGVFEAAFVQRLISDHEKGRADNGKMLWSLMVFQMWSDNYLNK